MKPIKNTKKLWLAALLVALLATLLCFAASAETYSGTCGAEEDGSNLTWTLDTETGELVISGTGAMKAYSSTSMPWYSYRSFIKKVIIGNGVTSIGVAAFSECTSLANVTFEENSVLTSIGDSAFMGCTSLTSVTIGNGVTSIGQEAFAWCKNLASVTFEENSKLTSIGWYAFQYCSLTEIVLPSSVTSISATAFDFCDSLTNISIAEGNEYYYVKNNCLIETASKTLILAYGNFTIPFDGSVTSIGDYAFFMSDLKSIVIPKSITSIGNYAFYEAGPTIYYCGSESDWNAITFGENWEFIYPTGSAITLCYNHEPVEFISYQVTKGVDGAFSLRVIAGLNSLKYKNFGYEITITTKDEDGNDVVTTLSGTDDKAYSSIYGGDTEYSIKENFGYEYAALATITNLAVDSTYTKIEIRSYVTTLDGEVKYGKGATLLYTGEIGEDGYPTISVVTE